MKKTAKIRLTRETLRALAAHAGSALAILAGGRIDAESAAVLVRDTGVRELHLRGARTVESEMRFRRDGITFGKAYQPDEYRWREVSEPLVREIVDSLAPG